jgi:hypothetical protein
LIVGKLKLQLTFETEGMSHKLTPYTKPLPIRWAEMIVEGVLRQIADAGMAGAEGRKARDYS